MMQVFAREFDSVGGVFLLHVAQTVLGGSLSMNGMNTADAALETLRGAVVDIVLGTIFLSIGATACAIAAIRWIRYFATI